MQQSDLRQKNVKKTKLPKAQRSSGKYRDKQREPRRQESFFRHEPIYGLRKADRYTNRFKVLVHMNAKSG